MRSTEQREFTVQFDFVPRTADGDLIHRTVTVRAKSAAIAADAAWRQRHSLFGAFGTDNAIDCRVFSADGPDT